MSKWTLRASFFLMVIFSVLLLSCQQYEYVSPLPGILEIRLRASIKDSTLQRFLPYTGNGNFSFFPIILKSLKVLRPDGSEQSIFSDLDAIRRNPDGDLFNCLDARAQDSSLVLGIAYFPPSEISRLLLTVGPPPQMQVVVNYQSGFTSLFDVRMPSIIPQELQQITSFNQEPLNVRVEEGRTTRVNVVIDIDQTLQRRTEWFEYHPTFYISSIQQF